VQLVGILGEDENEDHEDAEPVLHKPSRHGLGHLLNPLDPEDACRDWIEEVWKQIITGGDPPSWANRPAAARTSVCTANMAVLFKPLNHGKPYDQQIKPFNFLNITFVNPTERPTDEERLVLIAPYERDPRRWTHQRWTNRFNEHNYCITTDPSHGLIRDDIVTVKTYGETTLDYATHPEPKSNSSTGEPCSRQTVGLLALRPVTPTIIVSIGKESNRLEDVQGGLLDDEDHPLHRYSDRDLLIFRELAVPILKHLGVRETARRTGHGVGSVSAALKQTSSPRPKALARYMATSAEHAHAVLEEGPESQARDTTTLLRLAVRHLSATSASIG
jgi:hypothetical protein